MRLRVLFFLLTLLYGCCDCDTCKPKLDAGELPSVKRAWYKHHGEKYVDYLYAGPALVGRFNQETRAYQAWGVNGWEAPSVPPIPVLDPPAELIKAGPNFGVDLDKRNGQVPYSISGQAASREQVFAAMEADVPDDGTKARITIQGPQAGREPALRSIKEWVDKNGLAPRVLLWSGPEDDAILNRQGYKGKPGVVTVFVTDPTGKQLGRLENFTPTPGLAKVEAALSQWDGKLFPNSGGGGLGLPVSDSTIAAGVLGVCCIVLALRKPRLV